MVKNLKSRKKIKIKINKYTNKEKRQIFIRDIRKGTS